jgi:hypothetical protein
MPWKFNNKRFQVPLELLAFFFFFLFRLVGIFALPSLLYSSWIATLSRLCFVILLLFFFPSSSLPMKIIFILRLSRNPSSILIRLLFLPPGQLFSKQHRKRDLFPDVTRLSHMDVLSWHCRDRSTKQRPRFAVGCCLITKPRRSWIITNSWVCLTTQRLGRKEVKGIHTYNA